MLISIVDNWAAARAEHTHFLKEKLEKYLAQTHARQAFPFYTYNLIFRIKNKLLSCSEQDILDCINEFESDVKTLGPLLAEQWLINPLKKLFDYDAFCSKKKGWDAYDLCKRSTSRTCPYCNQAYAFTVQPIPGGRGCRPTLDHFYDKDSYPHLALVLNNLIPSCASCNSSLKHTMNFAKKPHLNPLFDQENIKFSFSAPDRITLLAQIDSTSISHLKIVTSAVQPCIKTGRSISTFLLEERYEMVLPEAIEFAVNKSQFDDLKREDLLPARYMTESVSLRFERSKYRSYILGKLFADIYDYY